MRAKTINEKYYALNNQPSFPQLKKDFHFKDSRGCEYWIAQENGDTFQNKNLRMTPDSGEPKMTVDGALTLYVKLAKGIEWFGENDIGKEMILTSRVERDDYLVRLSYAMKGLPKRRTGTIEVEGLDYDECKRLISKNSSGRK